MREQGDNNVDDANVKAWGYTQTEKSLVQQAQNLMIQYWNAQENLKSVQNHVSKAEKDYETANLKFHPEARPRRMCWVPRRLF